MEKKGKILIPVIALVVLTIAIGLWQKRRIIRHAKKFLGMDEIGDNMGWADPSFKKKMEAVGWKPGQSWCMYFVKAMWADVYPELKTKTINGKKVIDYLSGSSQGTYNTMLQLSKQTGWFKVTGKPKSGDIVVWQNYKNGVGASTGHVGIVSKVKGDYFETIEGNAQPLDSLILTPTGYVKMGDLKVGDELVSMNGEKSFVENIYPQGKRPIYEIVLNDLSKAKCSDNHLWKLNTIKGKEYIWDTLKLINKIRPNIKYRLPSLPKIDLTLNNELPIDPYVFGLLIGNGNLRLSGSKISTADQFVIDEFERIYPTCQLHFVKGVDYRITFPNQSDNPLMKSLRDLNYFHLSYDKYIPEIYKYTSYQNRLSLLQGLIDTDSHVDRFGRIEYSTSSIQLIHDIQWLIHSLGGRCRIQTNDHVYFTSPNQLTKKRGHTSYRIAVILPEGLQPCRQPRKLEKYKKNNVPVERSVKFINYIGEEECQCITVTASDHLYITDNFIPTHNTSELGNTEETVNTKTHSAGERVRTNGLRLKGFIRYTLA